MASGGGLSTGRRHTLKKKKKKKWRGALDPTISREVSQSVRIVQPLAAFCAQHTVHNMEYTGMVGDPS